MEEHRQVYRPTPTMERFHADDSQLRGVMGPIGSGKSVGCALEGYFRSLDQRPGKGGVRYSRGVVIRNTYAELKSTTIKTWEDWFPMAPVVFDTPIRWHWKQPLGDGTKVDMEVYFLALDKPKDVKKLKSLGVTWAWINEVSEIGKPILDMALGRVGRFPGRVQCPDGITWSGVFMDTNAMDEDHWYYDLAEVEKPDAFRFFRQPPAVISAGGVWKINPKCENVVNQPEGAHYWLKQVEGKTREWIRVYLESEYGTIVIGKPVYPEYKDRLHCSMDALDPMKGLTLWLSFDYGLTPACVFGQLTPKGQLRVIGEACSDSMGIRQFASDVVKPMLANRFAGMTHKVTGDPAGRQRAQTDETTCEQILADLGLPVESPESNDFTARRDAVSRFLTKLMAGTGDEVTPSFILSPSCRMLRKGFLGKYYYERVQVTTEERYKEKPVKNAYSHPHDALQYLAMKIDSSQSSTKKRKALPPDAPVHYAW